MPTDFLSATVVHSGGKLADPRPTVCQVLHSLRIGGAEVLAARLARQLSDRYRFVFACLDELGSLGEELQRDGFAVQVLGRRPGLDWRCVRRLARLLRQERVAVLHPHQYTPFFYSSAARWLGRRPPLVFTEHGRHFPDYPRRKRILANRLLLRKGDRVVGVGEVVRQALIRNEGIPAQRVSVIYNGIDLTGFRGNGADREVVRREWGFGAEELVLLQVARLDYLKDHATALRTLSQLLPQCPQARLVLVGEGPERPVIEKLLGELGLHHAVRLLGQRSDVPRLLAGADVFLLTSISEGIPLTVIEALAAGVPVVASRVGGLPEMVTEGETGLLAPAGDSAALAAQLLRLIRDRQLRQRLVQQGREAALAKWSERRMHAAYAELYDDLIHDA